MSLTVRWQNQEWVLLPERALYWPAKDMLLVADLHLGKGATFRAAGVPIPSGSTVATLDRLTLLIDKVCPGRLVILGDLFHGRESNVDGFRQWAESQKRLGIELITGNHDRWVNVGVLGLRTEREVDYNGILLCHAPVESPCPVVCGHVHPGHRLESRSGRLSERLACFWMQRNCLVLPAFGEFTGLYMVERKKSDRLFVIAGEAVLEVPK